MLRVAFDGYVEKFNARDYAGALGYWAPNFEVLVQNQVLCRTPDEFLKLYAFLHSFLDESIRVDRYLSDADNVFIEARVRVAGKRSLTRPMIEAAGFNAIMPIEPGEIHEIPQFIHYHLVGGKFSRVACVVSGNIASVAARAV